MTCHAGAVSLSLGQLKAIGFCAMLVEHAATYLAPELGALVLLSHIVGRLAIPIFCFALAQGLSNTRSTPRYLLRLYLFAAMTFAGGQLLVHATGWGIIPQNILISLALTATGLSVLKKTQHCADRWLRFALYLFATAIFVMCLIFEGTYLVPALAAIFAHSHGLKRQQAMCMGLAVFAGALCAVRWAFGYPIDTALVTQPLFVLALPLLSRYRQADGARKTGLAAYALYALYPLHLWLLYLLRHLLEKPY